MHEPQTSGVIHYYDTHPINEEEILAKLTASGADLEALSEDDLKDFDQDHYGGIEVVNKLAECANIKSSDHVLDVCSGMGGPARWLAHSIGCRVTGLDITQSRVESARRLTQRVGLDHRVDFVHGDAMDMPLPDASYDVLISQEAWAHVPDKTRLIPECARVIKPEGMMAFTSIVKHEAITPEEETRIASEMESPGLILIQDYVDLLRASRFTMVSCEDLSEEWTTTLVERLAMYRSLRDTTVAKFGETHFQQWDNTYSFFVGLYSSGKLGGTRIVAQKNSD